MSDHPALPRRGGARVWQWAATLLLAFGSIATLLVSLLGSAHLAEAIIRGGLGRAGVSVDRLAVESVGFDHIAFGPLRLGGADGPALAALTATWTPGSLLRHRLTGLRITGLRLKAAITPAGFVIRGLPSPTTGGAASPAAPAVMLPFDSLDLDDARLDLTLPAGQARIDLGAHIARQADATMLGNARIMAAVTIGTAPALALQAYLPRWTLAAPDQPLRLDVTGGKLTSPGLRGALGDVAAHLTATAADVDLKASATGADGMTGALDFTGSLSRGGKSSLSLTLKSIGISGELVSFSGIEGRIRLTALSPPRTATPQSITGMMTMAPLAPGRFTVTAGLPGNGSLRLEAARLDLAAGSLSLPPLTLAAGQPVTTVLGLDAVDLGVVLPLLGIDGLGGTGILDGHIPVLIDPNGVAISGGHLVARGPGILHYTGSALPDAVPGSAATTVSLLRQALADFHYTGMSLDLDRAVSGQGSMMIGVKGANPAVLNGYPFALNIRVEADFDRLASLLLSGYDAAGGVLRRGIGR
jgi:hypothetical protein